MASSQGETGLSTSPVPKATATTAAPVHSNDGRRVWQYRLRYKRARWKSPKHLYFARRHDAQTRIDGLLSDLTHEGRYQPIVSLTLDRRQVISQWEKVAGWEESP